MDGVEGEIEEERAVFAALDEVGRLATESVGQILLLFDLAAIEKRGLRSRGFGR